MTDNQFNEVMIALGVIAGSHIIVAICALLAMLRWL
jgi:hypothetical protein